MGERDVASWLEICDLDLRSVLLLCKDCPETAAYHCQQAAEKLMKAVLLHSQLDIPKTHSLSVLVAKTPSEHPLVPALKALVILQPYATIFRYPIDYPQPPPSEQELRDWVQKIETVCQEFAQILSPAEALPTAFVMLTNRLPP